MRDRVFVQETLAQPHCTERQADALFHFTVMPLHPFGAAPADIDNEKVLAAPMWIRGHSLKYRLRLLRAGEQPNRKTQNLACRLEKDPAIAAVAYGTRRHGAKMLHAQLSRRGAKLL